MNFLHYLIIYIIRTTVRHGATSSMEHDPHLSLCSKYILYFEQSVPYNGEETRIRILFLQNLLERYKSSINGNTESNIEERMHRQLLLP